MVSEASINVFTLNCWGIPGVSKHRNERMTALANELAKAKYDIVCLQEVWSESDYEFLKNEICRVLPYSHYFFSGVFGSGVCIFSRYVIEDVFFHQWPLNGYVHKIHHGDWFGGKGVGMCKVKCKGISFNIYSAHLHAEYNRWNDEYMAHRVLQAFDMSQFVRLTSYGADVVICSGDFNTEPGDLSYRIICHNAQLEDSFSHAQQKVDDCTAGTSECCRNSYTCKEVLKKRPDGQRIDYIMYSSVPGVKVDCLKYQFPLPDKVPGQDFSYSDHEAVQVSLRIVKSQKVNEEPTLQDEEYVVTMKEGLAVCNAALTRLYHDRRKYFLYSAALFVTLACTFGTESLYSYTKTYNIARFITTIILCYTLFMGTIWNSLEINGITAGRLGIEVVYARLLKGNKELADDGK